MLLESYRLMALRSFRHCTSVWPSITIVTVSLPVQSMIHHVHPQTLGD